MNKNSRGAKIRAVEVSKCFHRRLGGEVEALADLDLEVYDGELLCLMGPNGCGKSTLLNLLSGFEKPTTGWITIDGTRVSGPGPEALMLQQEYGLFPWRTVQANVEYGLEVQGVAREERGRQAGIMIEMVGLGEAANRYPRELSGGMQQRTALARALAVQPQILFLDEPFGSLDAISRHKMQGELLRIWKEQQMTIIFITHDFNEALLVADRLAVMSTRPGRIKEIIKVDLPRPRDLLSPACAEIREQLHRALLLS